MEATTRRHGSLAWGLLAAAVGLATLFALAGGAEAATRCVGTAEHCDSVHPDVPSAVAASAAGDVVRVRGTALSGIVLGPEVRGLTVDARLNTWATDGWRDVQGRVQDQGAGNRVLTLPFLRGSDGQQDPPSPLVSPSFHCSTAGFAPLDLHDAFACAHPGSLIILRPSANPVDPTPPGLGPYTVYKNRAGPVDPFLGPLGGEDVVLTDLTVCSAPTGLVCDSSQASRVALVSASGNTVIVRADGLTLRGVTVLVSGADVNGEAHGVEGYWDPMTGGTQLIDALEVRESILRPDALGGAAIAENGVRGRFSNAVIADNQLTGWAGAIFFRPYGDANTAEDNAIAVANTGVLTWSPRTRVIHNSFTGVNMAVDVAEVTIDPTTSADGNVLRLNDFSTVAKGVRNRAANALVSVDARLNSWGTDDWRTIAAKIDNTGPGNVVLYLPFIRASDGQQDPPPITVLGGTHCSSAGVAPISIGEALGCAHPGGTVLLRPSLNQADPTPHLETPVIDTNSLGEGLAGLTLCGTLVRSDTCVEDAQPGRWTRLLAEWAPGPGPGATGNALRMQVVGSSATGVSTFGVASTRLPAGTRIQDVATLEYDVFFQQGTCGGGSPRVQLGVDEDGDGDFDGNVFVYGGQPPGFNACPVGSWQHHELLDGAVRWDSTQLGGPFYGTQAQAAAAAGPSHRVLSAQVVFDSGWVAGNDPTSVLFFDNIRVNDIALLEPGSEACTAADIANPVCPQSIVSAGVVIDGDEGAFNVVEVRAPDVTVRSLTVRNPMDGALSSAMRLTGAGAQVREAMFQGEALVFDDDVVNGQTGCLCGFVGVLASPGASGYTLEGSLFQRWHKAGVEVEAGVTGPGALLGNRFLGNARHGVLVENADPAGAVVIANNAFGPNVLRGVRLEDSRSTVLSGNTFDLSVPLTVDETSSAGVLISGAQGVDLQGNAFTGNQLRSVSIRNSLGSFASDIVLRRNTFSADVFAVTLDANVAGMVLDARANDWRTYDHRALPLRVQDLGTGNRVRQVPFIDVDGELEPPMVGRVLPGATSPGMFLGVQDALDDPATGPGTRVIVANGRRSGFEDEANGQPLVGVGSDQLVRTPYLESVAITKDGIDLCGQRFRIRATTADCTLLDTDAGKPVIDATGLSSSVVRVTGDNVGVRGFVLRHSGEPSVGVDARGTTGTVVEHNAIEVGSSAAPAVAVGGLPQGTLPAAAEDYLANPFVASARGGEALAEVRRAHEGDPGFLGAAPMAAGHVGLFYEGAVPAQVAEALAASGGVEQGLPVSAYGGAALEPLAAPVSDGDLDGLEVVEGPQGPLLPGPTMGIGPGSSIIVNRQSTFGSSTVRCTANFVFRDGAGNMYLGSAGHCFLHTGVPTKASGAFRQPGQVLVCVADCVTDTVAGLQGTFVDLLPGNPDPVLWAQQLGVGADFGVVRIPASLAGLVRPWTWFWGGPTGIEDPGLGDPLVHYGHGVNIGEVFPGEGRAAVHDGCLLLCQPGGLEAVGLSMGGDSGSPILSAFLRTGKRLVGDEAAGILTHRIVLAAAPQAGLPLFLGTLASRGVALVQAGSGVPLTLVAENGANAPLPLPRGVGVDAGGTSGARIAGNTILGLSSVNELMPGVGIEAAGASGGLRIEGNELRGWAGDAVALTQGSTGARLEDNLLGQGCGGVRLSDAPGNLLRGNTFSSLGCQGVLVTSQSGGLASTGNHLRLNLFRGTPVPVAVANVAGITVDARLNDFGAYEWQVVTSMPSAEGNRVLTIPFLLATGEPEPGLPVVLAPASHTPLAEAGCSFDANGDGANDWHWTGSACRPISVQGALGLAHAGGTVIVPGSADLANPTPRIESATLGTNSLGEALTGVRLCSAPAGGSACAPSPGSAILDPMGESPSAITVQAADARVEGFTLRVIGTQARPVDARGSAGLTLADNVIEAAQSPEEGTAALGAGAVAGAQGSSAGDPWVLETLRSPDYARLFEQAKDLPGFLTAAPLLEPARHVGLIFTGAAPPALLAGLDTPLPVQVYQNANPTPLVEYVDPALVEQVDHKPGPEGPPVPGPAEGIGPGTHLLITRSDGTVRCTANFVFRGSNGKDYLGTAGHCVLTVPTSKSFGFTQPTTRACVSGCLGGTVAFGTFLTLGPVKYARQQGLGNDFGWVEIPDGVKPLIRPAMWLWGGPTGSRAPAMGDPLVHYGNGIGVGEEFPSKGRAGVALGTGPSCGADPILFGFNGAGCYAALGEATGGDSGSGVNIGGARLDKRLVGDSAAGDLTHSLGVGVALGGIFLGTTVDSGMAFFQAETGVSLVLVKEDQTLIPLPPAFNVGVDLSGASGATVTRNAVEVLGGDIDDTVGVRVASGGNTIGPTNHVLTDRVSVEVGGSGNRILGNTIEVVGGGCQPDKVPSGNCWQPQTIGIRGTGAMGLEVGNNLVTGQPRNPDGTIGGTNGIAGDMPAARIHNNTLRWWSANGIFLNSDAVRIEDNVFGKSLSGVNIPTGADGARLRRNVFLDNVHGVSIHGSPPPISVVLRENLFRLANAMPMGTGSADAVHFGPEVAGALVDARRTDWGLYEWRLLPQRVFNEGAASNKVLQIPFLLPDGSQEPPGITVSPGTHCGAAAFVPLSLQEAVGCAHPDGRVIVRPSVNLTDPTPYLESVVVDRNTEGELLEGLQLCTAPVGFDDCDHPAARGVLVDASGQGGPAFTILAPDVTLKGFTIREGPLAIRAGAAGNPVDVDARFNHFRVYRLSQVDARVDRVGTSSVEVVPFLDTDATTPILPPTARFTQDATLTDRLTPVGFHDQSLPGGRPISARTWHFGDGTTGSGSDVEHTYASLGAFTPSLTVENEAELTGTATGSAITVVNIPPTAGFSVNPTPSNRADPTVFTDTSTDRDGTIVKWDWDFGDGFRSKERSPAHTYAQLGHYAVHVTVTDNDDATASAAYELDVVNLAPVAAFEVDPEIPHAFEPTQFHDQSTDRDGRIVRWLWDFGDGFTSELKDPVHVFVHGGMRTVSLTLTDDDGAVSRASTRVWVCSPVPEGDLVVDPSHIHIGTNGCVDIGQPSPTSADPHPGELVAVPTVRP